MEPASLNGARTDDLASVEADFPNYRFWRAAGRDRTRYVARTRYRGISPHTVVTPDLSELRAALDGTPARPQPAAGQPAEGQTAAGQPADAGSASIAGMYNRWLGGRDNGAADRAAADDVLAQFPAVAHVARASREFVLRAVAHTAAAGISQFIDIGTGFPAVPAIHHIARHADPAARVVYVDSDPVVAAHARALLAGPGVAVVESDMRRPQKILAAPELAALIDLSQPVCVILASVLHFTEPDEADAIVAAFTTAMTADSYLSGTYSVSGRSPDIMEVSANGSQHETVCSVPLHVTITPPHTAKIDVICVVP
jgi:S-adenosyl methyltransferase